MGRTPSVAMTSAAVRSSTRNWRPARPRKRRAVEKSKSRLSHRAWKSRKVRGIPTFPPPRRLREINQNRTFHLLRKADALTCSHHPRLKPGLEKRAAAGVVSSALTVRREPCKIPGGSVMEGRDAKLDAMFMSRACAALLCIRTATRGGGQSLRTHAVRNNDGSTQTGRVAGGEGEGRVDRVQEKRQKRLRGISHG